MINKLSVLDWASLVLVIVGGLNWGFISLFPHWDIVAKFLGTYTLATRVIYGLVGLSALYLLVTMNRLAKK